jgi:hypothetical protein
MPDKLAELMRHANVSTTMQFYTRKNAQRTAAAIREAYENSRRSIVGSTIEAVRSLRELQKKTQVAMLITT